MRDSTRRIWLAIYTMSTVWLALSRFGPTDIIVSTIDPVLVGPTEVREHSAKFAAAAPRPTN